MVAWWRRDAAPARDVVQVRIRTALSAPFVGPVTLARLPPSTPTQPGAAATTGGIALVGWTDASAAVRLRVLPGGGGIVPITTIAEGSGVTLGDLSVGIAPSGAAVAVWTRDPFPAQPEGGDRTVRVATRSATSGIWSPARDLSAEGAGRAVLAMSVDGSAVAVWERAGVIEASVMAAAGDFGSSAVISAGTADARRPSVAVNDSGAAIVAWFQDGVIVAERPGDGAFGIPRTISGGGGLPGAALRPPTLALAGDGRAVAVWRRTVDGRRRIEAIVRPAVEAWGATTVISPTAERNAGQPALDLTNDGQSVVAWSQPIGISFSAIRARVLARSATRFGVLESVSLPAGRGTAPSVGMDAGGRAVLAWRENPVPRTGRASGRFFRAAVRLSPG